MFKNIDKKKILAFRDKLVKIQHSFFQKYGVNDIFSNSKVYEVLVANQLNHELIKGHSGSRDARNENGEFEYKHYKESSSNHTWTFNDFSDTTIEKLKSAHAVIFAHIDDTSSIPILDWYYEIPGPVMSEYLAQKTLSIKNKRKMVNISRSQLESLGFKPIKISSINKTGPYYKELLEIFETIKQMEKESGTQGLLTSNKIFELLTAAELGHNVNSEQGGREGCHDAFDKEGRKFEYKISKNLSWNFQDISDNVLNKYVKNDDMIYLAIKDPLGLEILKIYSATPKAVVALLKKKLKEKKARKKVLRRLQVSLSAGDLKKIKAICEYERD